MPLPRGLSQLRAGPGTSATGFPKGVDEAVGHVKSVFRFVSESKVGGWGGRGGEDSSWQKHEFIK